MSKLYSERTTAKKATENNIAEIRAMLQDLDMVLEEVEMDDSPNWGDAGDTARIKEVLGAMLVSYYPNKYEAYD